MLKKIIRQLNNNNKLKQKNFRNKKQNYKMNFKQCKINLNNFHKN